MATIYLHMGMPKTGTSHLQRFLHLNEETLNKYGYAYPMFESFPRVGRARNAYFIRHRIKDENGKRDLAAEQALINHNFDIISETTKEYDKIILSEEGLWNIGEIVWSTYLKETENRNLDTKIIVYLRRQDLFLQSFWAQKVKEKSVETFTEYVDSGSYREVKLDYYKRIKKLASYFGKDNLIIRAYEKEQYEGEEGNLTSDFLNILGLKLEDGFTIPDYTYNPSLTGKYLEIKRLLNRNPDIAVSQSPIKNIIVKLMKDKNDIGDMSKPVYFTKEEHRKFMSLYEEGNEKIAREFLGREDGILFREPVDVRDDAYPRYTTEELVDVCGELLITQYKLYQERALEYKDTIAKKDATIAHKQEVIDWETTPFPKKVTRKLKKIGRQILGRQGD